MIYKKFLEEEGFNIDGDIVVHEVYFGKNKYLLEAEAILGKMRKDYQFHQSKINMSKDMLKFNRLIEKSFGLECFCLNISYFSEINASTIPFSTCIDAPNYREMKSNELGFDYSQVRGSSVIVWVNSGLFFNRKFTDAEIMAMILHEIGHNFQTAISPMSRGFSYIQKIIGIIYAPVFFLMSAGKGLSMTTATRRWYTGLLEEWRKEGNEFYGFINTMKYVFGKLFSIAFAPLKVLNTVKTILAGPTVPNISISNIPSAITNLFTFKGETIADNFTTAYGYGPELTSALNKARLESMGYLDEKIVRSVPFLNIWYDFCNIPTNILSFILDGHPTDVHRCKHQIDMLNRELDKTDLDPKMKGRIRSDVKEIEKQIDTCTNVDYDNIQWLYTNTWSAFLLALCNGDVRSAISKNNFELFDKAYDENLRKIQRVKNNS